MATATPIHMNSMTLTKPPRIWKRKGTSTQNLIEITDDELVVASVPKRRIADVIAQLDNLAAPSAVFDGKATSIPLASIRSVQAPLGKLHVVIDYAKASRKYASFKVPVDHREMQAEILEEAERSIGPDAEYARSTASRLFSALKPFHFLMAIALLAGGFDHIATETFGIGTSQELIPQTGGRHKSFDLRQVHNRMPAARRIPYLGIAVLAATAVTGFLLATVGYTMTLSVLAGAAGLAALWTLQRLLFPQVTISVVNSRWK